MVCCLDVGVWSETQVQDVWFSESDEDTREYLSGGYAALLQERLIKLILPNSEV